MDEASITEGYGLSPWMRNAGRKKSHPVWAFFRDLRTPGELFCISLPLVMECEQLSS